MITANGMPRAGANGFTAAVVHIYCVNHNVVLGYENFFIQAAKKPLSPSLSRLYSQLSGMRSKWSVSRNLKSIADEIVQK